MSPAAHPRSRPDTLAAVISELIRRQWLVTMSSGLEGRKGDLYRTAILPSDNVVYREEQLETLQGNSRSLTRVSFPGEFRLLSDATSYLIEKSLLIVL